MRNYLLTFGLLLSLTPCHTSVNNPEEEQSPRRTRPLPGRRRFAPRATSKEETPQTPSRKQRFSVQASNPDITNQNKAAQKKTQAEYASREQDPREELLSEEQENHLQVPAQEKPPVQSVQKAPTPEWVYALRTALTEEAKELAVLEETAKPSELKFWGVYGVGSATICLGAMAATTLMESSEKTLIGSAAVLEVLWTLYRAKKWETAEEERNSVSSQVDLHRQNIQRELTKHSDARAVVIAHLKNKGLTDEQISAYLQAHGLGENGLLSA